ncbi:MAG: homocysteine S-methyltransferase family protein [Thermoguttaceae bacterium]|nr:homocysteine S-methyltransferase family protein [Thermoguttaceae bacterium]
MNEKLAAWLSDGPLLLDGGTGSLLRFAGLAPNESPDLWNLTFPEKLLHAAKSFRSAGSDILLTNSFGANRLMLARFGAAERVADVNRRAAEIARAAAGKSALVFGTIGPTGVNLSNGDVSRRELYGVFAEQAQSLAAAGVDGLVIETMTDIAELCEAIRGARTTPLPVAACMTFGTGKRKDRTGAGITPEEVAEAVSAAGADIIGANCGAGTEGFLSLCRRFRAVCALPVWMKPSAGIPRTAGDKLIYDLTPETFTAAVAELLDAGASFVGGCCGVTPVFIGRLRSLLDRRRAC